MRGVIQKVFTASGIGGVAVAMSMTRNSISFRLSAGLLCALVAGPVSAGSFATSAVPAVPADSVAEAPIAEGLPIAPGADMSPVEQVAQYSPVPPRGRPVSDHDHARETARVGENRGFEELMRSAQSRGRGEYLGVEPDISRNVYRFKFLRSGGNVVWVDVDGRTGRVIAERD
jgi:hypothetical protein